MSDVVVNDSSITCKSLTVNANDIITGGYCYVTTSTITVNPYQCSYIVDHAEPEPLKIVAAKPLCCTQCGAPLKIGDTGRYATCRYCQTIHSLGSE